MKFFHISDLHIGLKLFNRDLLGDQKYILEQIIEKGKEESPDAVVIAGDIYDRAIPSTEAVEVFDEFIKELRKSLPDVSLMLISGNHDSAMRMNQFRTILSEQNLYMIGLPPQKPEDFIEKVCLLDEYGEVYFYLLPFVSPSLCSGVFSLEEGERLSYNQTLHRLMEREDIDETKRNVLVSHQFYIPKGSDSDGIERMDSEICMVGNVDAVDGDFLERFDYAALGHIHKPMKVGSAYHRYCGTPLACSVSEAEQEKGIVVVEMGEKGRVDIRVLPLRPLRKVRKLKGSFEEVKKMACEDYVTVILTDQREIDPVEMGETLRNCFPYLLEIRRENVTKPNYEGFREKMTEEEELDPFSLCSLFAGDMAEEEKELLKSVMNVLKEGGER